MSFWTGYWLGRISGNNDNKGAGEGVALLAIIGVIILSGYAFVKGANNLADAVPVFLSYYMDGINVWHFDFYHCENKPYGWANLNDCFQYTRSFYRWVLFIKIAFCTGWLALILWSLASSRLAFWSVAVLSCLAIVVIWAMCGNQSCAAHPVTWLKGWSYWPEMSRKKPEIMIERIGIGLLGATSLLLTLILLRRGRSKERIRRFNILFCEWFSLYNMLAAFFGLIAICSLGILLIGIHGYYSALVVDYTKFIFVLVIMIIIFSLAGFLFYVFLRRARLRRKKNLERRSKAS